MWVVCVHVRWLCVAWVCWLRVCGVRTGCVGRLGWLCLRCVHGGCVYVLCECDVYALHIRPTYATTHIIHAYTPRISYIQPNNATHTHIQHSRIRNLHTMHVQSHTKTNTRIEHTPTFTPIIHVQTTINTHTHNMHTHYACILHTQLIHN